MEQLTISGAMLRSMLTTGAVLLERDRAYIDSLNVFPVPDGDTGTNMHMTMQSAVKELNGCVSDRAGDIAAAVSLGALKGARGNSGVILSQLWRGFASALKDCDDIDAHLLAEAMKRGSEAAYKAVMRPKEGTILTVVRMMSEGMQSFDAANPDATVEEMLDKMLEVGEQALSITPQLLPVLKEAGVIDSGGKGLLTILRGFKMAAEGEELETIIPREADGAAELFEDHLTLEDVNAIEFGYCTEFFIINLVDTFSETALERFRNKLVAIGDSVVVASDTGFVKVHVHSNCPGRILQSALMLGEVDRVKIENMREQNREIQRKLKESEREIGLVAVAAGDGLRAVFKDLGAGAIVEGGQTMNPSIDTILKAIRKVNARTVFVLPNNSNIILAAQQAAEHSDRNVIVVPTKTILEGIASAMAFNPDADVESVRREMESCYGEVLSGSVTYAVRSTVFRGRTIKEGDIMGLLGGEIETVGDDVQDASMALIRSMIERKSSDAIVTVFYGEDVTREMAEALVRTLSEEYPDAEFIVQQGGQPLYFYYVSVE
ncbi:MAG: DAK2 domain-containing protein [Clostridia bacterium]|nr:DAK2 domain-containing protein [Clostridia bacterium]